MLCRRPSLCPGDPLQGDTDDLMDTCWQWLLSRDCNRIGRLAGWRRPSSLLHFFARKVFLGCFLTRSHRLLRRAETRTIAG